eukprot:scaffold15759_cov112-Isochrysis_galbana.AAC.6
MGASPPRIELGGVKTLECEAHSNANLVFDDSKNRRSTANSKISAARYKKTKINWTTGLARFLHGPLRCLPVRDER